MTKVNWNEGGRVHNWRNYVGEHVRKIWHTFNEEQHAAIIADAKELASQEDWE